MHSTPATASPLGRRSQVPPSENLQTAHAVYVLWQVRYNVSMSIVPSAIYFIALCVCGWRVVHRRVARGRGERLPNDALLWLFGVVLILLPIIAAASSASGWSDPETLYPTMFSAGWVVALLAWDFRSMRSMVRDNRQGNVGAGSAPDKPVMKETRRTDA